MATLALELVHAGGRVAAQACLPLDAFQLAQPVLRAGLDWLRLQGTPLPAAVSSTLQWEPRGRSGELRVELGDGLPWEGRVPAAEIARIAMRGARALAAAHVWPGFATGRGDRVVYELGFDEGDPVAPLRAPFFPGSAGPCRLGIECEAGAAPPAVAAIEIADLDLAECLQDDSMSEVVVLFRPDVLAVIEMLLDESWRQREERALLLYGARYRVAAEASWLPLFDVVRVERPAARSAGMTEIVLEHSPFMERPALGAGAVGLLHTHLPPTSLEASDPDRRDLDDLNAGGPDAFSIIFHARSDRAAGRPRAAVHTRLGARGGTVCHARARLLVGMPRASLHEPQPTENTP